MGQLKAKSTALIYRNGTPLGLKASEYREVKRDLEREEQRRMAGKHLRKAFFGPLFAWIFGNGNDILANTKHPLN